MIFRAAALLSLLVAHENVGWVTSFQQPVVVAAARLHIQQQHQQQQRNVQQLAAASDYESDGFLMDDHRGGFYPGGVGDNISSFRVNGEGVPGHQVLTPREGPRPPTPRGRHMDVTTSYPNIHDDDMDSFRYRSSERMGGEPPLRVGGRPVEGHQVLRPARPPRGGDRRTMMGERRGDHMRVTTSNPEFIRTDRRGRSSSSGGGGGPPFYEDEEEYGRGRMDNHPDRRVYRGGAGVRPDTQDLQGVGRMPMRGEEWDRYRNVREDSTPFRPSSRREGMDGDADIDGIGFSRRGRGRRGGGDRDRGGRMMDDDDDDDMPHFLARDEGEGLPVDMDRFELDREDSRMMPPPPRRGRSMGGMGGMGGMGMDPMDDGDIRGINRESIREREWRDLQARNGRRGRGRRSSSSFEPARQDLRGLGRMPMRGADWDDMAYPERRGGGAGGGAMMGGDRRGRYDDDYSIRRNSPGSNRYYSSGDRRRRGDDFPPPPPRGVVGGQRVDPRRRRAPGVAAYDEEDDYIREGPHMVRSGLPSYREEEEERRRRRSSSRGHDYIMGDDDRMMMSMDDEDRYYRRGTRDLYNNNRTTRPPRTDRRGSLGGPMSEELFGVDSEYAATRQGWAAGTSMDTI